MPDRPRSIVRGEDLAALDSPPRLAAARVGFRVRPLSDAAGLTRMGVKIREIPPGLTGTHLHFHDLEEEWAYVLAGRGIVRIGPLSLPVRSGSFTAFPPGPRPHHFVASGDGPLVILEGGERRWGEDSCTYPELGVRSCRGEDERIEPGSLPAFEGGAEQLVHTGDVDERARKHPLAEGVVRHQRAIDAAAGLTRQACAFVRVEAGGETTAFHTHTGTDEWVYLLSGEAEVRLGSDWHDVAAGDFIGHPANSAAHVMRARSEITYLMGGEHVADDVVLYPELGMRLTRAGFERILPTPT